MKNYFMIILDDYNQNHLNDCVVTTAQKESNIKLTSRNEIDLWKKEDQYYLGHDEPSYKIDIQWLLDRKFELWVHCKNIDAFENLSRHNLNYFWHEDDKYTLTSKQWVWAYPDQKFSTKYNKTVTVMPEWYDTDTEGFAGICSDYIERYR